MAVALTTYATSREDASEQAWSDMVGSWWTNGVWPNELNKGEVYADSTGMQVKVRSLRGNVEGFHGQKTSESTLSLSPADVSDDRIDLVTLRLVRTVPATVFLYVIEGTPADAPVPAPLVNNSTTTDVELAAVRVNAGAPVIAATAVTDLRRYAGPIGFDQIRVQEVTAGLPPLTAEGNGYWDFPIPYDWYIGAERIPPNPQTSTPQYTKAPVCEVMNFGGYCRVVLTGGTPGQGIGLRLRYLAPGTQIYTRR